MVKYPHLVQKLLLYDTTLRTAAVLIFDKCLSPRQTTANNGKTAFSLHVVESASDDYNFYTVFQKN